MTERAVRPAVLADVDRIVQIEAAAGQESWTPSAVHELVQHPCGQAYVLHVDGRVVGHLMAMVVIDEAEIITIAVHPAHQRRGLGAFLLDEVLEHWSDDVARVLLEVRVDNAPAQRLYLGRGFEQVGVRPDYYADGTDARLLCRERPPPTSSL